MDDTQNRESVDVTVTICTWNRAALLDQALSAMRELRIPENLQWELLVVNNNSTDDTNEVIARHSHTLPIRALWEPKPGHSNARNCAVAHARGSLLLWTDDDVLVDPDWMMEYVEAARAYPDADFFGGVVAPRFAIDPPDWIARHIAVFGSAYALRQAGDAVRPLKRGQYPFGANMMIRARCLREVSFNPEDGRVKGGMLSADEINLMKKLVASGKWGVWVGTARVHHCIGDERLTEHYLRTFYEGIGRGYVRTNGVPDCALFRGAPLGWWWRYWRARICAWLFRPVKSGTWAAAFKEAAKTGAMVTESRETTRKSTQ